MKGRTSARNIAPVVTILLWMVTILAPVSPAYAAVPAGYSEYFIPGGEDQLWAIYEDLDNNPDLVEADGMHAVIAVTAAADDTTVYYDHWEDGYDAVPATPGPSTEVYVLDIGDVQEFESSNIPIPRGSTLNACDNDGIAPATDPCYDGRDRIYVAGGAVTVTRASWAESIGTVFALAWEIYPTEPFLTNYTIPVGQDLAGAPTLYDDFDRVYVIVQATTSGTSVAIDNPSTAGVDVSTTLNEGETTELYSIDAGTTVSASQPVQVQFIVGQFASGQASEARGYSAVPDSLWDTEYYSPVGGFSAGDTDLFLYNPNGYTITINYEDSAGTGSFTVPADSTLSYSDGRGSTVPLNSAVHIYSSDVFWGIGSGDTESYNYDWGYSLVPAYALTDEYFLGWAPGDYNPTPANNGSPVFVTPVQDNTTVFVDFSPTDDVIDVTYTLDRLDSQKIFDSDDDNTGMHLWATGPIAVAWGEDPDTASIGNPYMDLGYTTLPLPEEWIDVVLTLDKSADPTVLADAAGEVSTFTIVVETADYPVDDVDVIDTLPDGWLYVAGSTQIDGSPSADPSIAGQVLTWDLNIDMGSSDSFTLTFDAETDDPPPSPASGYSENVAQAVGTRLGGAQVFSPSDNAFIFFTSLTIDKDTSTPSVSIGDTATYTIVLENIGAATVTNVTVADTLPTGFTYASGSVVEVDATRTSTTNPGVGDTSLNWGTWDIDPGGTLTITFDVDVNVGTTPGTYDNTATADSTEVGPIDDAGNSAQDANTPSGEDPEDDEDVTVGSTDLSLSKSVDDSTPNVGDTVSFTITLTNAGPDSATNISVEDVIPDGYTYDAGSIGSDAGITGAIITTDDSGAPVLTWDINNLDNGESVDLTFDAVVLASGNYINVTQVTACDQYDSDSTPDNDDGDQSEDDEDSESVTPVIVDLSLSKSVDDSTPNVGDTVTFTVTLTNTGPDSATNISVEDVIPNGYTYAAGSIGSNAGATGAAITTDDSGAPTLTWDIDQLDSGESVDLTFDAVVLASGNYTNVTQVTACDQYDSDSTPDNDDGDQSEDDEDNESVTPVIVDLSLSKSVDDSTPNVGDTVSFTVTLTNAGPDSATNISVEDVIPNGYTYAAGSIGSNAGATGATIMPDDSGAPTLTWDIDQLDSGESVDLTFDAVVLSSGNYINVTQVTACDQYDSDSTPDNDDGDQSEDDEANASVAPLSADLSLIKIVNDTSPDLGDMVTFTLTLNNSGPDTAANIVVEDVIPAGLTYVPGSITGGDSNDDSAVPVLTWDVNSLASGTSAILTFQATVDTVGTSTNVAQVIASDLYDPDSTPDNDDGDQSEDDEDNASVTVATIIDPALTKTGDPSTASVGDTVVFTITVENEGNTDALDVEVVDTLPVFLDIIDVTVVPDEGQPVTIVGNTVTIDMGTVSPTDFYTITVTTEVNALGEPPGDTNSVGLTTSSLDEDLTNNDDDFFLAIVAAGGLPETGFAPGVVTSLPAQPESKRYTSYFTLGLEIPKLDVDIPIVGVPKTETGWDVSWLWDDVGYLQGTAFPTWQGNTAITGHVTLPSGLPGPFANLSRLSWSDEIVINFFGMRYVYSVREVSWVRPEDMSPLGHEDLDWVTLITCSGFDEGSGAYRWRTVVRAVLVRVEPQP